MYNLRSKVSALKKIRKITKYTNYVSHKCDTCGEAHFSPNELASFGSKLRSYICQKCLVKIIYKGDRLPGTVKAPRKLWRELNQRFNLNIKPKVKQHNLVQPDIFDADTMDGAQELKQKILEQAARDYVETAGNNLDHKFYLQNFLIPFVRVMDADL